MIVHLVVVRAFGKYARGDSITDAAEILSTLTSEHMRDVVRVSTGEG